MYLDVIRSDDTVADVINTNGFRFLQLVPTLDVLELGRHVCSHGARFRNHPPFAGDWRKNK